MWKTVWGAYARSSGPEPRWLPPENQTKLFVFKHLIFLLPLGSICAKYLVLQKLKHISRQIPSTFSTDLWMSGGYDNRRIPLAKTPSDSQTPATQTFRRSRSPTSLLLPHRAACCGARFTPPKVIIHMLSFRPSRASVDPSGRAAKAWWEIGARKLLSERLRELT
jgi:hypothetical protein